MDKKDVEVLAQSWAPLIREYVRLQLEPLQRRIVELERRTAKAEGSDDRP